MGLVLLRCAGPQCLLFAILHAEQITGGERERDIMGLVQLCAAQVVLGVLGVAACLETKYCQGLPEAVA